MSTNDFTNQVAAELAFAKAMGWDDWTSDEENEQGTVRGYRVQWSPHDDARLIVNDEDDDDATYVRVTGQAPTFKMHTGMTAGQLRQRGGRIGEG